MKTKIVAKALLASSLLTMTNGAIAAAFQLAEVSTSGLGRAYAGEAAIADNASVIATNPALMTQFKRPEFSVGGVYIDSKINLTGDIYALANSQPITQTYSANQNNVVPGAFVPNMYYVMPINDRFAFGAGMNVNFGLKSEYDNDYSAGMFGGTTELTAINLNLSGAYRISKGWSVGAGLNAVYATAKIERTVGILDEALSNIATAIPVLSSLSNAVTNSSTLVHLKGDAWGLGWNAGLTYEFNENNRIGFAYHSKVDLDFKDNQAFSYQPGTTGIASYTGVGRLTLPLPSYWEISGYHKLLPNFAVHYSYKYTEWSRLKELRGVYENGATAFQKEENYKNSGRIALGVTYDLNEKLTLRAGMAYDEAAAPRAYASASIPDTDRTWYSLGATYSITPDLSVDFAFAHLRGKTVQFEETQVIANTINIVADYTSRATANLYGINLNYRF